MEKQEVSKWFAETADWYILHVKAYEEQHIATRLQAAWDTEKYLAFVPMRDYAYHKKGRTYKRRIPWIHSYVFIAATVSEDECLAEIDRLTQYDEAVYKVLRNGGREDSAKLTERDRAFMRAILDESFTIPALEVVKVGDRLVIADGSPFAGMGGRIVRVDKHKHTATVAFGLCGADMKYTVALADAFKPPGDFR
jgi:transcription antitermination factor NusG